MEIIDMLKRNIVLAFVCCFVLSLLFSSVSFAQKKDGKPNKGFDPETIATMARKSILEIFVTDPPFDPETQVQTGPVETITPDRIDRVFTVRGKTAQERNAEDDAASTAGFEVRLMKSLALVILDELKALGSTTTPAQLRTAVIAKYRTTR